MNIALIADDGKKRLMENLCIAYRHILINHALYATGTTGQIVEEAANLHVHKYLAGHLGGERQLGAQISHNDIDLVIYLRDPQRTAPPLDINTAARLCDVHNIPLASNLATAEALLLALERGDLDWRNIVR
ncbi:MAG: methylglyoxal synthase [Clostridiales bacterium]|jgi:methylglyoxal synthase|nr:methylglyoxal synthase [Clostridiales bacterium]